MYRISELKKNRVIGYTLSKLGISGISISDTNIEMVLAFIVGTGAGYSAVVFRIILSHFRTLFFGIIYPALSTISPYLLPVVPMIGAVILIPFSLKYKGEVNGYGMPRFLISVHLKGGLVKARQLFVKMITASVTIASGGAAGVEGPIALIGGTVGSVIGRFFEIGSQRLKILVACGAAGGIAAQFNAPLAGILFAVEIVMVGEFQLQSFVMIVIASGMATAVSRAYFTSAPRFGELNYTLVSHWELFFYIALGILIGILAYLFIKIYFLTHDKFAELKVNEQLKPIIGAAIVGLMGLINFAVLSDGYPYMNKAIQSPAAMPIAAIALLIILKMFATSVTLGSGNVGGVYAPTLFIGAMIGAVFGWLLNLLFPGLGIQPGSYAMVGMGAFMAASTHAPMTAIFLLFELTGNYQIIIPIMFASVVGVSVARRFCLDSLDTGELDRYGVNLHRGIEENILNSILVGSVMVREFEALKETMTFDQFLHHFPTSKAQYYPVLNSVGQLTGVVSFQDIREILLEEGLENLLVMKDLAETNIITLTPEDNLNTAIKKFGSKDIEAIPVVSPDDKQKVLGILKRKDVLDTYNKAVLMQDMEMQQ